MLCGHTDTVGVAGMAAPFSPIITVGELVLPEVMRGIAEASITRKRSMPRTRRRSSSS